MTSIRDRIAPEFLPALDMLNQVAPGGFNAIADIDARRAAVAAMMVQRDKLIPPNERIEVVERTIPGPNGNEDLRVRVYRPTDAVGDLPGLYLIHGGGMILGDLATEHHTCVAYSDQLNAVVMQVDYRLAPEHPAPAAIEDCYAGLTWMAKNASQLEIDPNRMAILGGSAGGGLAASTVLVARDRGFPALRLQVLIAPMLDHRNETPSSHQIVDLGVWDRSANLEAWSLYLGDAARDGIPPNVVPARADTLAGLPPTFVDVGELDLFRDEDIAYATALISDGVPTELHVYPGVYHAADNFTPQADYSQRIRVARLAALRRALSPGVQEPGGGTAPS